MNADIYGEMNKIVHPSLKNEEMNAQSRTRFKRLKQNP
jgi:hypothetical protein